METEEELIRTAKKLDKMVSRKHTDGALVLLQKLKSTQMTLKLLQRTRIGMSVNSVRKHSSDEEIVSLSKVLIRNWKKLMEIPGHQKHEKPSDKGPETNEEKPHKAPGISPPSLARKHSRDKRAERRDSLSSMSPKSPSPMPRKNSMDKEERRHSVASKSSSAAPDPPRKSSTEKRARRDLLTIQSPARRASADKKDERDGNKGSPTSPTSPSFSGAPSFLPPSLSTGESIRDKCIEMISAALKTDDDYKQYGSNCDKMAAEIEDYIYQEFQKTDMKYKNRVRSRISNLKDPKNPSLRNNVLSGMITLVHIARMTAEEMASDELKDLRNVLTQEAIREHQMAKTSGTHTSLLQCGKCKKKNCTYNQVQTRSADEPMTTFVLCNECGNRWKFC
eukprot:gi/632954608/ref/XP_007893052.1/ PREDICTED: transcription elongation factor A protein 3-like [Callorhinchus milii]